MFHSTLLWTALISAFLVTTTDSASLSLCNKDDDCPENMMCHPTNGTCECKHGHFLNGACKECGNNDDCELRSGCFAGKCDCLEGFRKSVSSCVDCFTDLDCKNSSICRNETCVLSVEEEGDSNYSSRGCVSNSECDKFERCDVEARKCACVLGRVNENSTKCAECRSAEHCPRNAYCGSINECFCKTGISSTPPSNGSLRCLEGECATDLDCPKNAVCGFTLSCHCGHELRPLWNSKGKLASCYKTQVASQGAGPLITWLIMTVISVIGLCIVVKVTRGCYRCYIGRSSTAASAESSLETGMSESTIGLIVDEPPPPYHECVAQPPPYEEVIREKPKSNTRKNTSSNILDTDKTM